MATKAKQTESNFGDEAAPAKRKYTRRATTQTATKTASPAKRTYRRKTNRTTDVAMVTIQVPASMAFQIGMALGREIRA